MASLRPTKSDSTQRKMVMLTLDKKIGRLSIMKNNLTISQSCRRTPGPATPFAADGALFLHGRKLSWLPILPKFRIRESVLQ